MNARRTTLLAVALAVAGGLALLLVDLAVADRPSFPLDDTWIHLQFAQRLAGGDGLAYSGEGWVTGSTAPLWTALLALGAALPSGAALYWPELLCVLAFVAVALGARRLALELGAGRDLAGWAALLVVLTPRLWWSAGSGMEILPFTAAALWGMALHAREMRGEQRTPVGIAVLSLSVLLRPEGAVLLSLAFLERLARRAPRNGLAGLCAATLLMPSLLFYRVAGGSFLPTTFWAKAGGPTDPWPAFDYFRLVLDVLFRSQPILVLLAGGGVLWLVAGAGRTPVRSLLPAAWLLGQTVGYAILAGPDVPPPLGNFGRYYFPLLPVVVVLALLPIRDLRPGIDRLRAVGVPLSAWHLGLSLLVASQVTLLWEVPGQYAQNVEDVERSDVRAARWLAERLDPEAVVAAQDVGAAAYFLPNEVVDLAGLTTPDIIPLLRMESPVYWEQRLAGYLAERRVDYLFVFRSSYPGLTSRMPGFEVVRAFTNEDNRTMAGSELVIVRTPWARFPLAAADETDPSNPGDETGSSR